MSSYHFIVLYLKLAAVENTDLEVLAEGFGADSTLQLSAKALIHHQRPMWRCVAGGCLPVVAQQLVLAAELQATHIAGKELNPYMREGVGDPGGTVRERGPAQSAEAELRQVGLSVSSDGGQVWRQKRRAGSAGGRGPGHLEE